jgi:hypothetical protein
LELVQANGENLERAANPYLRTIEAEYGNFYGTMLYGWRACRIHPANTGKMNALAPAVPS